MLKNNNGSLLVDVLLALLIIGWTIELLYGALYLAVRVQNQPQKEDRFYEIYERAVRLYDD